jgi:hypothetical protein
MHEYDIALKGALRRLTGTVLRQLTGCKVARWENTELSAVQSRRADMLGETVDGKLLHIELQSTNQAGMAGRMLEYAAAIYLQFGQIPEQLVLYVGGEKLRMKAEVQGPAWTFRCRMVDIRELDGDRLIAGGRVEDNVIAVLAGLRDERTAIRRILGRIARCGPRRRASAFEELMLLAGLRGLGPVIRQEARQMPILDDIMDHSVLGPERRRGIAIGVEKGRQEGERTIILRQISRRFGKVPPAIRKRIEALPPAGLEKMAVHLLDAPSLDELLRSV